MAQIEAEDFQAMSPLTEIGLASIALGGIAREARGDDELCAGSKKLQTGLISDLDAATSEDGDAAGKIGQFGAFGEVEICALRTQLIVEMMNGGVVAFADVAVLGFEGLVSFGRR